MKKLKYVLFFLVMLLSFNVKVIAKEFADCYYNFRPNDDGNFRQLFNKNYIKLLISLDDYCSAMLNVRTLLRF